MLLNVLIMHNVIMILSTHTRTHPHKDSFMRKVVDAGNPRGRAFIRKNRLGGLLNIILSARIFRLEH